MGSCYVTQGAQPDSLWQPLGRGGVGGGGAVMLGGGREFQDGGDIYRPITDSC